MRGLIIICGFCFSVINLLPIPWPLRLRWFRLLYFLTVKGTLLFPSILHWTKRQNVAYKMGKQTGEEYESIVQLEKVLEYLEKKEFPAHKVDQAMRQAEKEAIPSDQIGVFIARNILDPLTAEQVLKQSLQTTRY